MSFAFDKNDMKCCHKMRFESHKYVKMRLWLAGELTALKAKERGNR